MPVVTINDDGGTAILTQYIDAIENTASVEYSATTYEYLGSSGSRVVFLGDFTVDAEGNFVGGAATQIRVFNSLGVRQATITDVAIDSADFVGLTSILDMLALHPDALYRGGDGGDYFYPDFDDDTVDGSDTIRGGDGNDTITGSFGDTQAYGEAGDDLLILGSNFATTNALFDGGGDVDTLSVGDTLYGSDFDLALAGPQETGEGAVIRLRNIENILAYDGDHRLGGNATANRLEGGAGDDSLDGAGGADTLLGGDDDDSLLGADGFDLLRGNGGDDTLNGGAGADTLEGGAGDDSIVGGDRNDVIDGGVGADTMSGGTQDDRYVVDDAADDVVENAGEGVDLVEASVSFSLGGTQVENLTLLGGAIVGSGNALRNDIRGNAQDNVLNGASGSDALRGGGGADTFVFSAGLAPNNVDVIADFNVAADTIRLGANAFAGLGPGPLAGAAFFRGSAAHDASDRIIYDPATGALLFDPDGTGAADAVRFATLDAGLALTRNDFVVA